MISPSRIIRNLDYLSIDEKQCGYLKRMYRVDRINSVIAVRCRKPKLNTFIKAPFGICGKRIMTTKSGRWNKR